MNEFLKQCDFSKSPLWVRPYPSRTCVYDEADAVVRYRKDDPALVRKVVARYRAEGYPEKAGMAETNVIAPWKSHCTSPGLSLNAFPLEKIAVTNGSVAKTATKSQPGTV